AMTIPMTGQSGEERPLRPSIPFIRVPSMVLPANNLREISVRYSKKSGTGASDCRYAIHSELHPPSCADFYSLERDANHLAYVLDNSRIFRPAGFTSARDGSSNWPSKSSGSRAI